jgi:hypothetical protein
MSIVFQPRPKKKKNSATKNHNFPKPRGGAGEIVVNQKKIILVQPTDMLGIRCGKDE